MSRIYFNEVATRDGFQNEPVFIPTEVKVSLIDALSECGFAKIEVTSFTSPKAIPMLRDADEVMRRIKRLPGVEYTVLVPNMRGAERALEVKADELNLVMSSSETHNLANLRMPREQSFAALSEVIRMVDGRTPINVSLSCCFGCPMEGVVPQDVVIDWAQRFVDQGVRGLTICDTTGMAHPAQVSRMVEALQERFLASDPSLQLTMHFHNTRGMGLANVLVSAQGRVQHANHLATMHSVKLHPLGQQFGQHGGGRHGEYGPQCDAQLPAEAEQQGDAHAGQHGDQHLQQPEAEYDALHGIQLGERKLQADREHEEHHPEFGQRRQTLDVGHQVERMWANDAAYSEITQHRWQVESAKQDDGKNRGSQQKQNKG